MLALLVSLIVGEESVISRTKGSECNQCFRHRWPRYNFLARMGKHNQSRKKRIETKRRNAIAAATATIEAIAERQVDAYEGWQRVCGIFQKQRGARFA
jgi:hypothetical protein